MPPVNDPQKQDPAPTGGAPQSGKPPQDSTQVAAPAPPPAGWVFKSPLFDGDFTGRITQPSPTQYQGLASYLFKNGDTLGANALLGTQPFSLENYGANGTFGLGRGGSASLGFDVQPPKGTSQWLADLKFGDGSLLNANLATSPFPDDTQALEAVAAGQCDLTLVNTYYFGRLMAQNPDLPLAIFWPNQNLQDRAAGVHVNISGAGVTRHAKNPAGAQKLIEWLSSDQAQNLFADVNLEYPVNPKVTPDRSVAAWGSFRQNLVNVKEAGSLQVSAVKLMDRVGYK